MTDSAIMQHLLEKLGIKGQRILVVGAGGTIGEPTCIELARRGAMVIPSRTSAEGLKESLAVIRAAAGDDGCSEGVVMNMLDNGSIEAAVEKAREQAAGGITGVLLNAGGHDPELIIGRGKSFGDTNPETVERFFRKNLLGQRHVMRCLIKHTHETPNFTGVFTGSVATSTLSRVSDYAMAKAALMQFADSLALQEGAFGHRYLSVVPGFVTSGRKGQQNEFAINDPERYGSINNHIALACSFAPNFGRWATGQEIADVTACLFSPAFRYVTGTRIVVDGGFSTNKLGNNAL